MNANYETKTIAHLGLVAGMFDELGIGELLDEVGVQDFEQRQVTIGQAVKAMVLNGLGFANRRLYLTPHFFRNKPTERLVGEGVTAEQLNADTLGKALDTLHGYGVSELYSLIAARAVNRLGLAPKVGHQNITSFHVDGEYNSDEPPSPEVGIVHLTRGYSRDNKPDLNRASTASTTLICSSRGKERSRWMLARTTLLRAPLVETRLADIGFLLIGPADAFESDK